MKSFSAMLVLSAVGATMLSTHLFAQSPYSNNGYSYNRYAHENEGYRASPLYDVARGYDGLYDSATVGVYSKPVGGYPNPVSDSSSASAIESGTAFHLDRGYPGYFEFTGE